MIAILTVLSTHLLFFCFGWRRWRWVETCSDGKLFLPCYNEWNKIQWFFL